MFALFRLMFTKLSYDILHMEDNHVPITIYCLRCILHISMCTTGYDTKRKLFVSKGKENSKLLHSTSLDIVKQTRLIATSSSGALTQDSAGK